MLLDGKSASLHSVLDKDPIPFSHYFKLLILITSPNFNNNTLYSFLSFYTKPLPHRIYLHAYSFSPLLRLSRLGPLPDLFIEMETAADDLKKTNEKNKNSRFDFGKMDFGCKHYKRRCKIRAPCCNEIFGCRHCHNESTIDRHEVCRHDVEKVICLVCDTEQPVGQLCKNCGVSMGEYYCQVCKFYDDDVSKGQYHCYECGICRVGGKDNFFHCKKCGSCYSVALRDKHSCIENSMRHHCPICYEYLFDSLKDTSVLRCGHTIHAECFEEMKSHAQYSCPICSKSVCDMSGYWRKLDEEVAATIMPLDYRYKVWILCNDCNDRTEVLFHIIGHKCDHCNSYNTRTIAPPAVLPR